jgi:hypothetical protein
MKKFRIVGLSAAILLGLTGVFTACKDQFDNQINQDGDVNAVAATVTYGGGRGSTYELKSNELNWSGKVIIKGYVRVTKGKTLTIAAGTRIEGDKQTAGTLIVERGGKINAVGKANSPIVFTSNESAKRSGDWGGVVICGNASVNVTGEGNLSGFPRIPAGSNRIEGLIAGDWLNPRSPGYDPNFGLYGGSNDGDNSGTLRFIRIEYAGVISTPDNETNGLTMAGVGSGTKIDHIQVAFGNDDAFEWFGGTVNCKYLFSYRNRDDDFDTDFGYQGRLQFLWALRDPAIGDNDKLDIDGTTITGSGSNGFESDNNKVNVSSPRTQPIVYNATIVGPDNPYGRNPPVAGRNQPVTANTYSAGYLASIYSGGGNGALNRRNTLQAIYNSALMSWPNAQYNYVKGDVAGSPEVTRLFSTTGTFVYNSVTSARKDVVGFIGKGRQDFLPSNLGFLTQALGNIPRTGGNLPLQLGLPAECWNLAAPNPRPNAGSVLLSPGVTPPPDNFFNNVSFRGAFTNVSDKPGSYGTGGWEIAAGNNWVRYFAYGQ